MDIEYCDTINELLDTAENWCLTTEELYDKAEIHSINTSKEDTDDVGSSLIMSRLLSINFLNLLSWFN